MNITTTTLICIFFTLTANATEKTDADIDNIGFCWGMNTYLRSNNIPLSDLYSPSQVNRMKSMGILELDEKVNKFRKDYINCRAANNSEQECTGNIKDNNQKIFLVSSLKGLIKAKKDGIEQAKLMAPIVCNTALGK